MLCEHDVLDLFKQNGERGGNACCIFMNYMTPVCSQKILPKKAAAEKQKKQTVGLNAALVMRGVIMLT